jgi:hypothetical protein
MTTATEALEHAETLLKWAETQATEGNWETASAVTDLANAWIWYARTKYQRQ